MLMEFLYPDVSLPLVSLWFLSLWSLSLRPHGRGWCTIQADFRFCLRHYAAFMRMGPIPSRIHMRLGADSVQRNGDWRTPWASFLAAQSATRQLTRNRGRFGKELHRRSIALWLSAVSEPFPRRCSVNPEMPSSGAISWYLKPRRLQFPGKPAGRHVRPPLQHCKFDRE